MRTRYSMGTSRHRPRLARNASTLSSSEKGIPSAVRVRSFRTSRRNTHIPLWESRPGRAPVALGRLPDDARAARLRLALRAVRRVPVDDEDFEEPFRELLDDL